MILQILAESLTGGLYLKSEVLSFNARWRKADKVAQTGSGENSTFTSEAV